ncbi:unnamed protein product, partial [Protopolystoma xenopodis]
VEEAAVREKAVESLRKIAKDHSQEDLERYYYPLVRRLSFGKYFTARISACGLLSIIYRQVNSYQRRGLCGLAKKLAK